VGKSFLNHKCSLYQHIVKVFVVVALVYQEWYTYKQCHKYFLMSGLSGQKSKRKKDATGWINWYMMLLHNGLRNETLWKANFKHIKVDENFIFKFKTFWAIIIPFYLTMNVF